MTFCVFILQLLGLVARAVMISHEIHRDATRRAWTARPARPAPRGTFFGTRPERGEGGHSARSVMEIEWILCDIIAT